jgi:hypothetical protein
LFIPTSGFCQYKIGLAKSFQSMDNVYQEAKPGDFTVPGRGLDQFFGCTGLRPSNKIFPFYALMVNPGSSSWACGPPVGHEKSGRAGIPARHSTGLMVRRTHPTKDYFFVILSAAKNLSFNAAEIRNEAALRSE